MTQICNTLSAYVEGDVESGVAATAGGVEAQTEEADVQEAFN